MSKERIDQISVDEKCSGCESRLHLIEYEHTSTIPAIADNKERNERHDIHQHR